MKGGELRTLIEGREGTPVKLGLERRDGPDMFGNRRLRRMVEINQPIATSCVLRLMYCFSVLSHSTVFRT